MRGASARRSSSIPTAMSLINFFSLYPGCPTIFLIFTVLPPVTVYLAASTTERSERVATATATAENEKEKEKERTYNRASNHLR